MGEGERRAAFAAGLTFAPPDVLQKFCGRAGFWRLGVSDSEKLPTVIV